MNDDDSPLLAKAPTHAALPCNAERADAYHYNGFSRRFHSFYYILSIYLTNPRPNFWCELPCVISP